MSKSKIGIVLSTTREGRFGDTVAAWIAPIAKQDAALDFEIVDLRDYPLPVFDEPRSPAYHASEKPEVRRWSKKMAELDGYLFVTAEYNRSVPAVLKNALDHVYAEVNRKPAAFVGYGSVGGARAVEHLRLIAVELQMAPTRFGVHVAMEPFLAVMQGQKSLADFDHLNSAAETMLTDLAWWVQALRRARDTAADAAAAA
jgi:NAD(P)H-dependent FMN reductase